MMPFWISLVYAGWRHGDCNRKCDSLLVSSDKTRSSTATGFNSFEACSIYIHSASHYKFSHIMEPRGSSPCSQQPTFCPCPQPVHPVTALPSCLRSILILSFHLCLGLPSDFSSSGFSTKFWYVVPFCPNMGHVPHNLTPPDLVTQIMFTHYAIFSTLLCFIHVRPKYVLQYHFLNGCKIKITCKSQVLNSHNWHHYN